MLRKDVLTGCVSKPWESAHPGQGREKRSLEGPGGQAVEVEGGPEECRAKKEFKEAAVLNSVAAKQRARRRHLRGCSWVWQQGGAW